MYALGFSWKVIEEMNPAIKTPHHFVLYRFLLPDLRPIESLGFTKQEAAHKYAETHRRFGVAI